MNQCFGIDKDLNCICCPMAGKREHIQTTADKGEDIKLTWTCKDIFTDTGDRVTTLEHIFMLSLQLPIKTQSFQTERELVLHLANTSDKQLQKCRVGCVPLIRDLPSVVAVTVE